MKYEIYGKDEDEPSSASDNIQQHQTNLNELHYSSPTSPFNNLQLPSNNQQPYDNLQQPFNYLQLHPTIFNYRVRKLMDML